MDIDTIRFSHILEANMMERMDYFLSHTAFIVSHKSESVETLQGVLWYLPVSSPIIIVTNCPRDELTYIRDSLKEQMPSHRKLYVIHQKDRRIARLLKKHGVEQILDENGLVRDGKGEGMYVGTLCASLLGYPQWLIFYDADNTVPCSLLEYTLAMGKLFLSATATPAITSTATSSARFPDFLWESEAGQALHNVRVCWSSKPEVKNGNLEFKLLGRCTSVISPLFSTVLDEWFGIRDYPIVSSNAGEQGMTMKTAKMLRFSSHYSVETFQFLDFLHLSALSARPRRAILQQYQSKSPHFHTKGDEEHIRRMIAQSLGSFFVFQDAIPRSAREQLQRICDEMQLDICYPVIYPSIESLNIGNDEGVEAIEAAYLPPLDETEEDTENTENTDSPELVFSRETFVNRYRLFREYEYA